MLTLTYLSTATTPFDRDELVSMLTSWRHHNDDDGISGMLLYAGGHFIQTLEGPDAAVQRLYDRIVRDHRHRDIVLALHEPTSRRAFEGWSMGFEEMGAEETDEVPGFTEFLEAEDDDQRADVRLGRAGVFHRVFRDRMR